MTTIFESTDRDGDTTTVSEEHYFDGAAVTVGVRLNGETSPYYAYLSAAEVDRLRVALAPFGTGRTPRDIEDAAALPSRAVVKRAQASALAVSILGPDTDALSVVSLAAFIAGGAA